MQNKYKIGIVGLGMVGGALQKYFEKKPNYQLFLYDKYKKIGSMEDVNKADYIYLCVPTPFKGEVGCDTSIVESIIKEIDRGKVVVIKSTVIPGTTDKLQDLYPHIKLMFNPEFLTEATADQDMEFPDRQIIGYTTISYGKVKEVLLQLPLAPFERMYPAFIAEFIKYGGNCWFCHKVAKNNELYDLFRAFGGTDEDFLQVVNGMSADKRIDRTHMKIYHKQKRGYGGKCLPKDSKALLMLAKKLKVEMPVLSAVDKYNDKLLKSQCLDPLDTDSGVAAKEKCVA
jgi:UDPglucose 6-dehydrogenase